MLRIGVTQRVDVAAKGNERRDALDQRWSPFLSRLGCIAVPIPNLTPDIDSFVRSFELRGFVLTGGNDLDEAPERDRLEKRVLDLAAEHGLPVIGVCRGMQILCAHHGGTLSPVSGHVASRHDVRIDTSELPEFPEELDVNSYHNWGVLEADVPDALRAIGWAADGTVEFVRHRLHPQFGMMWHPEREATPRDVEIDFMAAVLRGATS